jgi:hypothetical protein
MISAYRKRLTSEDAVAACCYVERYFAPGDTNVFTGPT